MKTQYLRGDSDRPIVIETPAGFIRIFLAGRRQLKIELPDGLTANKGDDRAKSSARFVDEDASGHVRPRYKVLTPQLNAEGDLVGVTSPPVFAAAKR